MNAKSLTGLAITNLDGRTDTSDGKTCRVCLENLGWFPTNVGPTERQLEATDNGTNVVEWTIANMQVRDSE